MTPLGLRAAGDLEATISRCMACMENASDPQEQREWQDKMLAAIRARNAALPEGSVEELERRRGLRK
jgi:hypothetical protein